MPANDDSTASFSSGRRWLGALNTTAAVVAALALTVMVNYLAGDEFLRFHFSRDAAFKLSSQTRAVLNSLTNEVQVTIFFQPDGDNQEIYGLTSGLLTEYQNANPRHIHVRLLDYTRFAGPAKELLSKYELSGPREKDFVLFESNGHSKVVYARELADYDFSDLMAGRSKFVRRSAFKGELLFTSDIYAVSHPQALKTYFLTGHRENNPGNSSGEPENLGPAGYSKLAAILKQELDSDWDVLSLQGSNDIPHDCQLLIVAGPRQGEFLPEETNKIAAYLKNGGRLLALLTKPCGLEPMLSNQWSVRLGNSRVMDKDPRFSVGPYVFLTADLFAHAIVNPLAKDNARILMVYPRPVYPVGDRGKMPGAPEVTVLAETSKEATDENKRAGPYPLLAAIEQGVINGVDTPRSGGTQIVVAGDADFLDDGTIDSWPVNHDFAKLALSWLLQRPQITIEGLAPQPIKEYKLYMTSAQRLAVGWLFLGAMPASVLVLGGLVWLRRRH
jgi:ABC-2 type transport system permease protein